MFMRMLKGLALLAALTAIVTVSVPQARAAVKVFFGWHTVKPAPSGAGSGQATFDREARGEMDLSKTSRSLDEARRFLGNGVVLPPSLEGAEMLLYREVDKEGKVLVIGLSAPNAGFWARYRPAGDHKLEASYGSDLQATTEHRVIGGRPARVVTVTVSKSPAPHKVGKKLFELWLEDGLWVYEMRADNGDLEHLVKMAEAMR